MPYVTVSLTDYTKERSAFKLATPVITSVNINDYTTVPGGYIDDLTDALAAITLGTINKEQLVSYERVIATALPSSQMAQRELKALIRYHDSVTGNRFTFTVPTIDPQFLLLNSDEFDIEGTAWAAFVAALETAFVSPDGNLMVVDSAKLVGRNI